MKGWASILALSGVVAGWADAALVPALPQSPAAGAADATGTSSDDTIGDEIALQRGILDFQKGKYEEALKRLDAVSPSALGASYYRGLSLLGLRRTDDALREFERLRRDARAPSEADLGLGVARLAMGDSRGAEASLDTFLKARPNDPYGHYLMGVAQNRQGREDDARAHFARAAADPDLAPNLGSYKSLIAPGPAAPAVDDPASPPSFADISPPTATFGRPSYLGASSMLPGGPGVIPGPGMTGVDGSRTGAGNPDRRFNLAVLNGYEYDSNVALVPSIAVTGLGSVGRKADSRYQIASFGEYRFIQREKLVAGLIGSTYDTFQFTLPRYNVQDYMGGVYANTGLGRFVLGNRYEFHDTLLGGKQFTTDHRLTPNLTIREGSFGHFTTFYEFESLNVTGFALTPAQRRSGNINAVGATQAFYLAKGNGRLFFNYRYENAQTQGSDFDRSTNQVSARLEIPIPGKMVFNTEFRQFFDDYKHPNSLDYHGRTRSDNRIEARVGLQKFFTDHLSLRVDYVYTNNHSNVQNLFGASFYSYDRSVLSTQLIFDF